MIVVAAVLAAIAPAPPAQVTVRTVQPKVRELGKFSDLWHRCHDVAGCEPGRNIRRHGVKFKWISENGERRHWGEREPHARDVGRRIRVMRSKLATVTLLPYRGPGGTRWAIPWYIVSCESHGRWSPRTRRARSARISSWARAPRGRRTRGRALDASPHRRAAVERRRRRVALGLCLT